MLGDRAARSGGDQGGGRGNVEGTPPAACSRGVEQVALAAHGHRHGAHRASQPGELVDGLALRAQGDQEGRDLHFGGLAVHDPRQHLGGLIGAQVATRRQRVDRLRQGRVGHQLRKFASSPMPCSVRTDSGWNWTPSAGSSRWRTPISTSPPGRGLETNGQLGVDDERVVAPYGQRAGQAGEDRAPVVLDRGGLAVDGLVDPDGAPEGLRESLVAETDPKRRDAPLGHPAGDLERDTGLVGGARSGRDHAPLEGVGEQFLDARTVVADRHDLRPELPQVLHEVVGEGVVVVDHEHAHGTSTCNQRRGARVRGVANRDCDRAPAGGLIASPVGRRPPRSRRARPGPWPPTPRTRRRASRRRRSRRPPGRGPCRP